MTSNKSNDPQNKLSEKDTKSDEETKLQTQDGGIWHFIKTEAPFFLGVLAVIFTLRIFIYDMNYIPSESMQPTMEVGDRIVVNKFAYGISRHTFPFSFGPSFSGKNGRLFGNTPKRGDVITFRHPTQNVIYIKRVIGLPGDIVQYRNGQLWLNNKLVTRTKIENFQYKEYTGGIATVSLFKQNLEGGRSFNFYEKINSNQEELEFGGDKTDPFTVPEGHLFVMGDNRDNSQDSRFSVESGVGYLPIDRVLGRAERVFFSTYKCKKTAGLKCAKRKFFSKLD